MKRKIGVIFFACLLCFIVWMGFQFWQQGDLRPAPDASAVIRLAYRAMVAGLVLVAIGWPGWLLALWSQDGFKRAAKVSSAIVGTGSVVAAVGLIIVILS
jgi:hypothetical protein